MPVKSHTASDRDGAGPTRRLLWVPLLGLLLTGGVLLAVPFFGPFWYEHGSHHFCVAAGTPMQMATLRFGLGINYGGDPYVCFVGPVAWLVYWY